MPKTAKVLTFRIVIPKIVAAIAVTMLLSVSQPLRLTAVSYGVKSLSVDDGLSQSMAYCILQDSRGFIWIGTQDGLNRYDGKTVKTYRHDPNLPGSPGSDRYFPSGRTLPPGSGSARRTVSVSITLSLIVLAASTVPNLPYLLPERRSRESRRMRVSK